MDKNAGDQLLSKLAELTRGLRKLADNGWKDLTAGEYAKLHSLFTSASEDFVELERKLSPDHSAFVFECPNGHEIRVLNLSEITNPLLCEPCGARYRIRKSDLELVAEPD